MTRKKIEREREREKRERKRKKEGMDGCSFQPV